MKMVASHYRESGLLSGLLYVSVRVHWTGDGCVGREEACMGFVLRQIVVKRYPKMGESIISTTAPYGFKGFLGMRNFTLKTEEGESLSWANSIWTNISTETGLPARLTDEDVRDMC